MFRYIRTIFTSWINFSNWTINIIKLIRFYLSNWLMLIMSWYKFVCIADIKSIKIPIISKYHIFELERIVILDELFNSQRTRWLTYLCIIGRKYTLRIVNLSFHSEKRTMNHLFDKMYNRTRFETFQSMLSWERQKSWNIERNIR